MRTPIAPLVWKEVRESGRLLLAGVGVFGGLPLIAAGQARWAGLAHSGAPVPTVVLLGGGVAAVLLGVAAATRDLSGRLDDFWRSRPVSAGAWLAVKFAVGLAGLLAVLGLPLAAWGWAAGGRLADGPLARDLIRWLPYHWAAVYAAAFAAGCLIRRPAPAAAVGVAALVLLGFAPAVLPPIERFGVPWLLDAARWGEGAARVDPTTYGWRPWPAAHQWPFAAAMVWLAAAGLGLAVQAVRHDWRVRAGPRLMYGAIGGVVLLVVGSAGYHVGSNLPVRQVIDLEAGERLELGRAEGASGVLLTRQWPPRGRTPAGLRLFTVTPAGVDLGPPVELRDASGRLYALTYYDERSVGWTADRPAVAFLVVYAGVTTDGDVAPDEVVRFDLAAVSLDPARAADPVLSRVRLHESRIGSPESYPDAHVYAWGDRVYAMHKVFDASDPTAPRLIGAAYPPAYGVYTRSTESTRFVPLARTRPLPTDVALKMVTPGSLGHTVLYEANPNGLSTYRLTSATEIGAAFERIGQYERPLVDRFFGSTESTLRVGGGYAYLSSTYREHSTANRRLAVVDVRDPARLRSAGHFAVPSDTALATVPLPDGRALVGGGSKLYVVGPPPGR